MSRTRTLLAAACALYVLGAAGCGSSTTTTTVTTTSASAAWAEGVCSAIVFYRGSVKDAVTSIKAAPLSKPTLETAVADVRTATQELGDTLRGLGKPGTAAGASAQKALDDLAASLKAHGETIRKAADESSALSAVATVSSTLVAAQTEVTKAVDTLKSVDAKGELHDAFAHAPSCKSVTGD